MENPEITRGKEVPDHYPTICGVLVQIARGYGRSLDSTVRLIGTCLISTILFAALWASLNAVSNLLLGGHESDSVIHVIILLCAPPIIRAGMIGGGINRDRKP